MGVGITFIIRSGRKVPTPAMPMPDLAVPYAAPMPKEMENKESVACRP